MKTAKQLRKDALDLFMNAWIDTPERRANVMRHIALLQNEADAIDKRNGVVKDDCPF